MVSTAIDLSLDDVAKICRRHHVAELSVFGSVLRDDFNEKSDVDFLVEFETDAVVGIFEMADLQLALAELLQRKVDLAPKDGLKPLIRDDVLASAQVVYASK